MPTVAAMKEMFTGLDPSFGLNSTFRYLQDVKNSDIEESDAVVFVRPNEPFSVRLAKKAKEQGALTVTFLDDDLLHYSPLPGWRRRGLIRTLGCSDVILTPSRFIGEEYREYTAGKRYAKIDTVVKDAQLVEYKEERKDRKQTKIVYAAGAAHEKLYNDYAKAAVERIIEKYGDRVSLTFVGVRPQVDKNSDTQIRFITGMPLQEYRDFMADEGFDVGIAPLADSRFTKCKYINKYIEYTLSGVCGIYSNVLPYNDAVIDGKNGLLADNNEASWYKKIEELILNRDLIENCIRSAQTDLKTNYSEEQIIGRLLEQIPEFAERKTNKGKYSAFRVGKAGYSLLRIADAAYLSAFYLKAGGLIGFTTKLTTHFRERGAYSRKGEK